MKIRILKLIFNGAILGVFIGFCISILISILYGKGDYIFVTPELVAKKGNEINAVIFQGILYMIYGIISNLSSIVYEKDKMNMVEKTAIHFFITIVNFSIMAKLSLWLIFDFIFIIIFFIIFFAIYLFIWSICYFYNKNLVNKLNTKLK